MCGIIFTYSPDSDATPLSPQQSHVDLVSRRGPDATHQRTVVVGSKSLTFTSSLLSVRGSTPIHQPFVDSTTSSLLCWNGNAWRIGDCDLLAGVNDTVKVFEVLLNGAKCLNDFIGGIHGEFAFVYFDHPRRTVWYGRDWAGRRSLVKRVNSNGSIVVASVGDGEPGWIEVDAGGLWCLDVGSGKEQWITKTLTNKPIWNIPKLNTDITNDELSPSSAQVTSLHENLQVAIRLRVEAIPPPVIRRTPCSDDVRLAILFSGGVDCTMLARIAHDVLPLHEPIDLLNVAFENPRIVSARQATRNNLKKSNLAGRGAPQETPGEPITEDEDLDPYSLCPDRTTGLNSCKELLTVCPGRNFRFVAINVPYCEVLEHRPKVIGLMSPHNTEMDLSIALAFYFASRGSGILMNTHSDYTTPARILLSGLGADELLGGYTRHATAFSRSGYPGLLEELQLDFDRLGKRNLGRDDRVVSNWAREIRYPFLDEKVVSWAMSAPVTAKCSFATEKMGKTVLRVLARKLSMNSAAGEAKRAVQFGARCAKMSANDRRMKGTDSLA